jgi:hypothetical protein
MPKFSMDDVELVQPEQEPGDGPPGEGKGPPGDGPPGEGKGPPGDGPPGEGKAPDGDTPDKLPDAPDADDVDVDKVHKEVEDRLKRRKDLKDTEAAKKAEQDHPDFTPSTGRDRTGTPGKGGGIGQLTGKPDPFAKPRYNWKQLVKQMIPSGVPDPQPSYAKPSRRAATAMHVAGQTGAGALPPGQKMDTSDARKLAFVFDTSGSMHHTINKAMVEIPSLIKAANFDAAPIGMVFFAGDMRMFVVNIRENTYQEVPDLTSMGADLKKFPKKKNWKTVLTMQAGGGTEFNPAVLVQIKNLIDQNYNIVMFSDSDMLVGENWENFVWLTVKHREHIAFVANTKTTWRKICKKLNMNLPRFSYLEE